jgi:hypothetical protein
LGKSKSVLIGRRRLEGRRRVRRARRERREHIAGRRFLRSLATQVNQAPAVGVLQRVNKRRLPAGEQRARDEDPCETGKHVSPPEPLR